jgi:membrane protein implicated in regulation of membrane protease activity
MQWWAWVAVGAVLLGSELAFIDAQFYLVFVGVSALIVGFLELVGLVPDDWVQWALFGLLAVLLVVIFRRRIYSLLRRKLPDMKQGPVGETVVLPMQLKPGESCRVEYCGSSWNATNGGASLILAGQKARIDRVNGLTLVIHGEVS